MPGEEKPAEDHRDKRGTRARAPATDVPPSVTGSTAQVPPLQSLPWPLSASELRAHSRHFSGRKDAGLATLLLTNLRWHHTPGEDPCCWPRPAGTEAVACAPYLTRRPRELAVSQLHVQPELPSVDTAILPLLHALDQLDVGLLQVRLPLGALGLVLLLLLLLLLLLPLLLQLLLLLGGLWGIPGEAVRMRTTQAAGRHSNCVPRSTLRLISSSQHPLGQVLLLSHSPERETKAEGVHDCPGSHRKQKAQ